jgi:hypothetical protein
MLMAQVTVYARTKLGKRVCYTGEPMPGMHHQRDMMAAGWTLETMTPPWSVYASYVGDQRDDMVAVVYYFEPVNLVKTFGRSDLRMQWQHMRQLDRFVKATLGAPLI